MTNAKNFVDFAVANAIQNASQDYLGKVQVIELLRKALHEKVIDEVDLVHYCWDYKVSIRHFNVDLKKALEKIIKNSGVYPQKTIQGTFGCDNGCADRVVYGLTRSYVNNDIIIELIFGMHKDILRGEVESAVLS